jgi:phage shock protein PspC (stress-responsive transcriptional regulator)
MVMVLIKVHIVIIVYIITLILMDRYSLGKNK